MWFGHCERGLPLACNTQPDLITTGRSNRSWSGCESVLGRCASWRAGSDLPVSLSGEVAEARRSSLARSAIARDAVGALDLGGAASDAAQRPLDQCDCFDRLRPPRTGTSCSGLSLTDRPAQPGGAALSTFAPRACLLRRPPVPGMLESLGARQVPGWFGLTSSPP